MESKRKNSAAKVLWKTFQHNGVYFPPPFKKLPATAKVRINGKVASTLAPHLEEYLVKFVQFLGGEQGKNKLAQKNFLKDLLALVGVIMLQELSQLLKLKKLLVR